MADFPIARYAETGTHTSFACPKHETFTVPALMDDFAYRVAFYSVHIRNFPDVPILFRLPAIGKAFIVDCPIGADFNRSVRRDAGSQDTSIARYAETDTEAT